MRILVVSDTHGRNKNFSLVYENVKPVDMVIHLGDFEGGEGYIRGIIDCELKAVAGNNDYFSKLLDCDMFYIGKYNIFIAHGNQYGVMFSNSRIKKEARDRGADIVMYGHTHRPVIDLAYDDIWAVNPGSLSYPRQEDHKPSYIIMEIDRHGDAHFTINYI